MMLGGDYEVLHTRTGRRLRLHIRVIQIEIEVYKIFIIHIIRHFLDMLHPFVARWQGIQNPVVKQAEAVMLETGDVTRRGESLNPRLNHSTFTYGNNVQCIIVICYCDKTELLNEMAN